MPIFVSRFSPNRVAGANLQRLRPRDERENDRLGTGRVRQDSRTDRTQREEEPRGEGVNSARERENLPVRNQQGSSLLERLQARTDARQEASPPEVQAAPEAGGGNARVERQTPADRGRNTPAEFPARVPPGVGTVRSRADREIDRPGRLGQEPATPALQQTLDRFARLRTTARRVDVPAVSGENGRGNALGRTLIRAPQTPPMDREIDARIRMLAAGNQARSGQTAGASALQAAAAPSEPPTALQISRANTTPEIRENLQDETREVERGLRRDATLQTRADTRRTAQAAGQAGEARRNGEIGANQAQARALRTQERRLEQDLRETQRNIRNLDNRTRQLRGTGARGATAAAVGSGVDLLIS